MSADLDVFLKRLHLANARRVWRDLIQRAEKEQWSHHVLLETLLAEEVAHRRGTRLNRAVRAAKLPFLRTVEEFDFTYQSTLRLTTIGSLLAPDFVTEGRSVIFEGRPGRGKTHLAIAIAYRAMQNGFDALFTTAAELIETLSSASRAGGMREALADYLRPHVLVVDEVGYLACSDDAANVLYHVVNDRHIRRRAMIFTTNKHPKRWGAALHDDDLAEAIVDRILERGRLLRLDGPSVRTNHLPGDELADDDQTDPGSSKVSGTKAAEFPEPTQGVIRFEMPEDLLAPDHRARLLWRVVAKLDLSGFTSGAKALEGRRGRPLKSVQMLLTLWLYAISVGVGSARKIARLTESDDAFRWIVGDKSVSHARLSMFRIGHGAVLEKLFTDVLGVLLQSDLLSLDLVAQDGTRVRASASAPSFRREASLHECREQAALHFKAVLAEQADNEASWAERMARLAAAASYQKRVVEAIARVSELRQAGNDKPRASTTDADAHVMKMGDGGYRPAYNVQMATAGSQLGGPRTIVGILVTNAGTDMGSITPMLEQIKRRTGKLPKALLADAGHAKHSCIESAMRSGVDTLIPVPEAQRHATKAVSAEIEAWRARMETDEAKQLYRARASLCELPNAHLKTRQGVTQMLVRGLERVTCVALLAGIAANLVHNLAGLLA